MGTSLSGLTPATTFDGLLKVGDNDPLTADLKAISTGDGTDTILQLSNSALAIGGDVTITGTTNDDTANSLLIERLDGTDLFQVRNDRNIYFGSTQYIRNGYRFYGDWEAYGTWDFNNDVNIGTGTGVANTRLLVKGSGATSATTSLLVQNSAGDDVFSIKDNGLFTFNDVGGNDALTIENGANISEIRYNDNLWLGSSHGTYVPTLKIDRTAGLSVETNSRSLLNLLYDTGNLGIGETTPTARLHIKGEAPSGDPLNNPTALLVQNSAGSELFKVQDDGITTLGTTGQQGEINLARSSDGVVIGKIQGTTNGLYLTNQDGTNHMLIGTSSAKGVSIGGGITSQTGARFSVKGSGNDNTTTALLVQNSDGDDMLEVDDSGNVGIGNPNPLSATLHISSQSYFNNTTALRIQNSIGNNLFRVRGDGTTDIINSKYIFNQSGVSTGGAIFKGSGATSATTALLVESSTGTDNLIVRDNGSNFVGNFAQARYSLVVGANQYPDASAVMQADSTTQGFLPPRMTTTERDAINLVAGVSTPARGLMIYNTDTDTAECWNGTAWMAMF